MSRRKLVVLAIVVVAAVGLLLLVILPKGSDPAVTHQESSTEISSVPSTGKFSLSSRNVEVLQKINSLDKNEWLQAFAPLFRNSEGVQQVVQDSTPVVEVLPDTFTVHDTYATVDAKISDQTITFYLTPSDGQWLIAGQK